jgi:hypothetical protein
MAVIEPERRGMSCVRPAQELLARQVRRAGGGDELAGGADAVGQGDVRPDDPCRLLGAPRIRTVAIRAGCIRPIGRCGRR